MVHLTLVSELLYTWRDHSARWKCFFIEAHQRVSLLYLTIISSSSYSFFPLGMPFQLGRLIASLVIQ